MKKHKKVILYKLGRFQEDFEYIFPNIKIINYITDKKIKSFNNKKCIYINDLKNNVKTINSLIVICDRKNNQIKDKFDNIGFKENKDYIFLEDFGKILDKTFSIKERILNPFYKLIFHRDFKNHAISNSEMFKKMIYTDAIHNLNCMEPFRYAQIQPNGFLYPCCSGWATEDIGNIFIDSPKKAWNSTRANIFRLSIINKTYAFCNLDICPLKETEINKNKKRIDNLKPSKIPDTVCLAFDKTCNLRCKSCRECSINQNKNQLYKYIYKDITRKLFKEKWLTDSYVLIAAGQGEVFFSNAYKKIIFSKKMKKRDSIIIHTNGILLNDDNLNKLCSQYKEISIYISLDSINENTYKNIRRGGNLKILKRNLEKVSELKKAGKISYVNILCVVQKENYKELPEIAKLAIDLNFDRFDATRISNWGTFTKEEFKNISMYDDFGNPKKELELVLKDPIFKSNKIEFSGNALKDIER